MRFSSSKVSGMARKVYCATNIGRSIVTRVVRLQRNGFPENRPIKNGKKYAGCKKICCSLLRFAPLRTRQSYKRGAKHGQAVHKRTGIPVTVCIFAGNSKLSDMEIVTIEKKTFEEMKERFNKFSEHLQQLCSRYRPPEKMNWLDNADVCEKLNVSKRTLQTYRDSGRLAYSQINHKLYYRLEDVEAFLTAMSKELIEDE